MDALPVTRPSVKALKGYQSKSKYNQNTGVLTITLPQRLN